MSRGIGTLKDLIKKADAGHPISEDAIPPPVSVAAPKQDIPAAVSSPEPVPSSDGALSPSNLLIFKLTQLISTNSRAHTGDFQVEKIHQPALHRYRPELLNAVRPNPKILR